MSSKSPRISLPDKCSEKIERRQDKKTFIFQNICKIVTNEFVACSSFNLRLALKKLSLLINLSAQCYLYFEPGKYEDKVIKENQLCRLFSS